MVFTTLHTSSTCVYYSQGRCAKGDQCRFFHPPVAQRTSTPPPTSDYGGHHPVVSSSKPQVTTVPFCEFHKRGLCRFGEQCKFNHSPSRPTVTGVHPPDQADIPVKTQGSTRWESRLSPSASPYLPSAQRRAPVTSNLAISPFGPCEFFLQNRCTKGNGCPFPHTIVSHATGVDLAVPIHQLVEVGHARSHSQVRNYSTTISTAEKAVCKYFLDGGCKKGAACPFHHPAGDSPELIPSPDSAALSEPEVAQAAPYPPAVEESLPIQQPVESQPVHHFQGSQEVVTRTKLACKVVYGPGAAVETITTAFESTCLILHNIPLRTTQTELIALAEAFGPLKSVVLDPPRDPKARLSARVEYLTSADAAHAAQDITEAPSLRGTSARLDLRAAERGTAVLRSTKVKLSWFAPSLTAWAHYGTLSKAKEEAARLNGMSFDGRIIRASFQTPSYRQRTSFSVEIKGLPLDASSEHLKQFCHASSITKGLPSFDVDKSVRELRALLLRQGALESFELMRSDAGAGKPKLVAFAQFYDADAAAKAVTGLNGARQTFLRGSQVFFELIHSVKYMLPHAQFVVLRAHLEALRDALQSCKLKFHDKDERGEAVERVCIRAYGSDANALTRLKSELEGLMRGYVVHDGDGEVLWHDHFSKPTGRTFLHALSAATGTFIRCDERMRTIHIFGEQAGLAATMSSLREKARQLQAELHTIDLDDATFRRVLHDGFSSFQASLGETIFFDVVHRQLVVRGDVSDLRAARAAVLSSQTGKPIQTSSSEVPCPICFCDVENPLALPCGHIYCRPCLQHYLGSLSQATGGSGGTAVAMCLAKGTQLSTAEDKDGDCKRPIPLDVIRSLLSPGEEERLLEATFLSHIHSRPQDFKYCPTADCQTVYRAAKEETVLRCPSCVVRICAFCHVEAHDGLTCAEYKDNAAGGRAPAAERIWRRTEDATT
ncbi:hypothetical protein BN946_scf185008.g64 [Trametes cinnabarina]|uniref:RBR-type E3 ubiquitin transferase n=1 Tax=Pycnoporus cinnabarinus TaxID=5643 RepID=A0A060SFQ2_PYCCI|nr:hypothetical protein BN946_scf185008.g64 [Trametes cinnabarina]